MSDPGSPEKLQVSEDEKKMIQEWIRKKNFNEWGHTDYVWVTRGTIVNPREIQYAHIMKNRPDKPWRIFRNHACVDRFGGQPRVDPGYHKKQFSNTSKIWDSFTNEPTESLLMRGLKTARLPKKTSEEETTPPEDGGDSPRRVRTQGPSSSTRPLSASAGHSGARLGGGARSAAMAASAPDRMALHDLDRSLLGPDDGPSIIPRAEKEQIRKWLYRNRLDNWGKTTSVLTLKRPVFSRFGEGIQYDHIMAQRPEKPWKGL